MNDEFSVPMELKRRYVARRQADLSDLRKALDKSQFEVFRNLANNLRGTCDNYGFSSLNSICKGFDQVANERSSSLGRIKLVEYQNWISDHRFE